MTKRVRRKPSNKPIVNLLGEVWKPIPGWDDYECSNMGRVRSYKRLKTLGYPVLVRATGHGSGYRRVSLCRTVKGKAERKRHFVHQLVLRTFIGPPKKGEICLHGDGSRNNNCLSNLRWGTYWENSQDRDAHGTTVRGEDHSSTNLTNDAVAEIWKLVRTSPMTHIEIAEIYNTSPSVVSKITRRISWRHVTENLPETYPKEE